MHFFVKRMNKQTIFDDVTCHSSQRCFASGNGANIYCPTNPGCELCRIYCDGNAACKETIVHGNDCTKVEIFLNDGNEVARQMSINAPGSGGSVYVTTNHSNPSRFFRDGTITSTDGTDVISLHCPDHNTTINECSGVEIDGTQANNVSVVCGADAYCDSMVVYCPEESDLDDTSCNIECESGAICTPSIIVDDDSWQDDVYFDCSGSGCYAEVYCGYNDTIDDYETQLDFCFIQTNPNSCDSDNSTQCQPTQMPTAIPSKYPTIIPSTIPTRIPSHNLTRDPTLLPSVQPTTPTGDRPTSPDDPETTTAQANNNSNSTQIASTFSRRIQSTSSAKSVVTGTRDISETEAVFSSFSIIFTIVVMSCFILIAICGYIDARLVRRNETFSISGITAPATYGIDIVSGL